MKKKKSIHALILSLGLLASSNSVFAADGLPKAPATTSNTKETITDAIKKTITQLQSALDEQAETAMKQAHEDILGKHSIKAWENLHDRADGKVCVLTNHISKNASVYLAYVPEKSIKELSAVEYRWIPHAGLLVMPIDKSGADIKTDAYFDFLITGFDSKAVSKHVTMGQTGGKEIEGLQVPSRDGVIHVTMGGSIVGISKSTAMTGGVTTSKVVTN